MSDTTHYPQKILIVEDELPMLTVLKDNLMAAGFNHLLEAKDGKEGLAIALKEQPDLILLDILLPIMDGMTMLKKLREDGRCKDTKVILLTNLQADESIMKGVVADQPSFYLVKTDFTIEDVIRKVKITLGLESIS